MEHIEVSIIVPVYNTEKYLKECLNSLLNQNLRSYEIILINDGSTDDSEQIMLSYANKFEQIRYYSQKNSGQGSARNKGLELARGDYIYFMDSDDLLVKNSLDKMYRLAMKNELEAIFFDANLFYDKDYQGPIVEKEKWTYIRDKSYGFFPSGEQLMNTLQQSGDMRVQPCLYMVKKSIYFKNDIRFATDIILEDELFMVELCLALEKCSHYQEIVFEQRIRSNSTMTSPENAGRKLDATIKLLFVFDELILKDGFKEAQTMQTMKDRMSIILRSAASLYFNDLQAKLHQDKWQRVLNLSAKYRYFDMKSLLAVKAHPLYRLIIQVRDKVDN